MSEQTMKPNPTPPAWSVTLTVRSPLKLDSHITAAGPINQGMSVDVPEGDVGAIERSIPQLTEALISSLRRGGYR